jgi:hypothetical protein
VSLALLVAMISSLVWGAAPALAVVLSLGEAVDQPWSFTNGGSAAWFGQSAITFDGIDAAQSGAIGDGQTTSMSTTWSAPAAGAVSFWLKVSSEEGRDSVRFFVDGVKRSEVSGEVDWTLHQLQVGSGSHTLTWEYGKDATGLGGGDAAWVDQVGYSEGSPLTVSVAAVSAATGLDLGAVVALSALDLSDLGNGTTPFSRAYLPGAWLELTAPAMAGGKYFDSWTGCESTWGRTCSFWSLSADATVTATYIDVPNTLTVRSTNPASGADVAIWTDDLNGDLGGTTEFARIYATGQEVDLWPALIAGGHYFSSWTGCTVTDGARCSVTMSGSKTVTANYATLPPLATLTVASVNPASGVNIAISPVDHVGAGGGVTPFTRTYIKYRDTVSLDAPLKAGGHYFQSWTGCEYAFGNRCWAKMDKNVKVTASYMNSPYTLTVETTNPPSGVVVRVSPADLLGEGTGTTPFNRKYVGTDVHLTAPPTVGGTLFFSGWGDSCDYGSGTECYRSMWSSGTVSATYDVAPAVTIADGVDQPGLVFESGPAGAEWYGDSFWDWNTGMVDDARSTALGVLSWMQTSFVVPPGGGYLTFKWGCNLVPGSGDSVKFLIDGTPQATIAGNTDWHLKAFPISEGTYTLRWEMDNSSGASWGNATVDKLAFTATRPLVRERVLSKPQDMGAYVGATPADSGGLSGGSTTFGLNYLCDTEVTLSAPPSTETGTFVRWEGCDSTPGEFGEQCVVRARGGSLFARYNRPGAVDFPESVDQAWIFSNGGDVSWVGQADVSHDGSDAALSGWAGPGEKSYFETTIEPAVAGTVRFWWKAGSEKGMDFLSFYVDDLLVPKRSITGDLDWQELSYPVTAGSHQLRWEFSRGPEGWRDAQQAYGAVDEIVFVPSGLTAPASVTATDGTSSENITISWGDALGETGYKVYRSRIAASGFTQIGQTTTPVRTYDDAVGCGQSWFYRVRATNGEGDSVFSPANQGFTKICPPATPSWLNAEDGVGKFQVALAWENVEGEAGYRVYRSEAGWAEYSLIATLGPAVTGADVRYVDRTGCGSPVQEYSYRVVAFNAGGDSGFSPADYGSAQSCGLQVDVPTTDWVWPQGSLQTITWSGAVDAGKVRIDLFKGAVLKSVVALAAPNAGTFTWVVPALLATGSDYRVKVSWTGNPAINDFSDSFEVRATTGPIVVTPEATVAQGEVQTISWTGVPTTGKVKLLLYKNNVLRSTIAASAPNTGTFDWVVPGTLATAADYTVQVVWLSNLAVKGTSDPFAVTATAGPIVVTPSAAAVAQGEVQTITWTGVPATGNVKLLLYKNNVLRSTIAASTPNHGSYEWVVPGTLAAAADYTVQVVWLSNLSMKGTSDSFAVTATAGPVVVTTAPSKAQGEVQTITWTGLPATGNVKLLLYKNNVLKATIVASTKNLGTYDWVVPASLVAESDYTVQVVWLSNQSVKGTSDPFAVTATAGPIAVGLPAGGETWIQGSTETVTWSGIPATGNVRIDLYKGTVLYRALLASTPNVGAAEIAVPAVPVPTDCRVKVTWLSRPAIVGWSGTITIE